MNSKNKLRIQKEIINILLIFHLHNGIMKMYRLVFKIYFATSGSISPEELTNT